MNKNEYTHRMLHKAATGEREGGIIANIARNILEPLNPETAKLLKPARLSENDRFHISMGQEGRTFVVRAHAELNGERVSASHAAILWMRNIPEKKDLRYDAYEVAATDISALIINANIGQGGERAEFTEDAKMTYDYLLARFLKQTISAQQRALFKVRGEAPDIKEWIPDFVEHPDPEKQLSVYQKVGLIGQIEQEGNAEFMEQGTGKTPIAIARVQIEAHRKYARTKQMYKVLVCCPKNVRYNWQKEIHRFAIYPGLTTVLTGGELGRFKLLLEAMVDEGGCEYSVIICSYETISRSWAAISAIPWDLIIADESHMIKWHRADRTQRMLQLRDVQDEKAADLNSKSKVRVVSPARLVLTGTPVANHLYDLYTQLEFLGEGMSGFNSFENFRSFYGKHERKEHTDEGETKTDENTYSNLPFLQERLARIAFMITKKEALPHLPPKLTEFISVEMTKPQREAYVQLQERLILEIEAKEAEAAAQGRKMTVQNILTMLLRLAQITSGFLSWDPITDADGNLIQPKVIEPFDPNPKIDELVARIKQTGEKSKVLVWACFVPDLKAIDARLTAEGIDHVLYYGQTNDEDRKTAEDRFNNDPKCKVLIGNASAGGTGLNLRGYNPEAEVDHGCNCDTVIYFSQDWSMIKRSQSEDRAHRRGTRVPVTYVDLCVPGTIDEVIRDRVVQKVENANKIADVKEVMRRVLETAPEEED